jgi:hypothetical protein
MTVEDLFKKIGAQTMEIDALRLEIDKLTQIVARLQADSTNDATEASKGSGEKKTK